MAEVTKLGMLNIVVFGIDETSFYRITVSMLVKFMHKKRVKWDIDFYSVIHI